jgi:hypothetical protein
MNLEADGRNIKQIKHQLSGTSNSILRGHGLWAKTKKCLMRELVPSRKIRININQTMKDDRHEQPKPLVKTAYTIY